MNTVLLTLLTMLLLATGPVAADIPNTKAFNRFVDRMVKNHGFDENQLRSRFKSVEIRQPILDAISRPAEAKPWFEYREIFMTEPRIAGGVDYWRNNETAVQAVERRYHVPAEILIAILGVETNYGANTGKYRVMDALSTLGFAYPPRSAFFLKELENFLLLTRRERINPLKLMGSYAGAMGIPQFMPSSFRKFAVDFDHNHKRDIWNSNADALASVANYFARFRWQPGGAVAFPVKAKSEAYRDLPNKDLKPDLTIAKLRELQIEAPAQLPDGEMVKLITLQQASGEDLWIGLHNFYVITRYNHSPMYAMVVYQLSQAIADRKKSLFTPAEIQK